MSKLNYLLNEYCSYRVEYLPLGKIFNSIRNGFVGTVTGNFSNEFEGVRYLEGKNVHNGRIINEKNVYVTHEFDEKHKNGRLTYGAIVMVQSGHVGHAAVIPESLDNSAAHALIIFTDKIDDTNPDFLNYQYQTSKSFTKIARITKGNTIKHILSSDMKNFIVDIPLSGEQKRIASFFIISL